MLSVVPLEGPATSAKLCPAASGGCGAIPGRACLLAEDDARLCRRNRAPWGRLASDAEHVQLTFSLSTQHFTRPRSEIEDRLPFPDHGPRNVHVWPDQA